MDNLEETHSQKLNEARNNGSKPGVPGYQAMKNITPRPDIDTAIPNDGTEETNAERLNLSRTNNSETEPPSEEGENNEGEGEYGEAGGGGREKKIILAETLLLNMYIIPLDILGLLLIFIGLDDFWIIDLLTFPVTQFYFRIKGARAGADLAASILELIPYVGALPIKSVGLNLAIYLTNHPEKMASIPFIGKVASKAKAI